MLSRVNRGRKRQCGTKPLIHAKDIVRIDLIDGYDCDREVCSNQADLRAIVDICNRSSTPETETNILVLWPQATKQARKCSNRQKLTSRPAPKRHHRCLPNVCSKEFNILDLNDDCLRETFKYLCQNDLLAVANSCTRFRYNAQEEFATKRFDFLDLNLRIVTNPNLSEQEKLLRIFGGLKSSIRLTVENYHNYTDIYFVPKPNSLFRLISLNLYCIKTISELCLCRLDATGNFTEILRPLLSRLHKLELDHVRGNEFILQKLPLYSPHLCELRMSGRYVSSVLCHASFIQNYPKLTTVSIGGNYWSSKIDIENFLQKNPQLKSIRIHSCEKVNSSVFLLIAKHTPLIESVAIHFHSPKQARINVSCLSELRKLRMLKSLTLGGYTGFSHKFYSNSFLPNLWMAATHISLEHLALECEKTFSNAIYKLKHLKTLRVSNVDSSFRSESIITKLGKHIPELSGLHLEGGILTSADSFLELIQNANKLTHFTYVQCYWLKNELSMTFNDCRKMEEIVRKRENKFKLRLVLKGSIQILDYRKDVAAECGDAMAIILNGKKIF